MSASAPTAVRAGTPDARLSVGQASASARAGAPGAPVDCSVEVANVSEQMVSRAIIACELLDGDGAPVAAGLGSLQNVRGRERRSVRIVVYGGRSFASARAFVEAVEFQ